MTKFNIAASFRPDHYEWFPNFSDFELRARLEYMSLAHATLLTLENLERAISADSSLRDQLISFVQSPYEQQRSVLAGIFRQVGIPQGVCEAIAAVPREHFAPPGTARYSYLNTYLPWDSSSCVTAPGLVALMLADLNPTNGRIVEVGIGSGYHAACVAEMSSPDAIVSGIEFNQIYADFGQECLSRAGYGYIDIAVGNADHAQIVTGSIDVLYCTAAGSLDLSSPLLEAIRVGGTFQYVRHLTREEFEGERLPWLWDKYGSYEGYLNGDWQNYGCISTQKRLDAGFVENARLFDVKLVPLRHGEEVTDLIGRDEWLQVLGDLCGT